MNTTYNMIVDFARPYKSNILMIMKNDSLTRTCHFVLMNNGSDMDMSDVTSATVKCTKPDSTIAYGDPDLVTDDDGNYINELNFTIPRTLTDVEGKEVLCVTLYGTDSSGNSLQISSFDFYIVVRNELYTDIGSLSTDSMEGIRDAIDKCQSVVSDVATLKAKTTYPNPQALTIYFSSSNSSVYSGSSAVTVDLSKMVNTGTLKTTTDLSWS